MTPSVPRRILFVCSGNTCRSPMAAALLERRLSRLAGPWEGVEVLSAGLAVAGEGAGAAGHAIEVMSERQIDLQAHRATPADLKAVDAADLVLTMTSAQKAQVLKIAPHAADRVFVLREFTRGPSAGRLDVDDPLGRGIRTYRRVARELEKEVDLLVEVLVSTHEVKEDALMAVLTSTEAAKTIPGAAPGPSPAPAGRAPDTLAVGADHAGFRLKNELTNVAAELGFEVVDFGTDDSSSVDYPDFAAKVSRAVASGRCRFGLLVCGSGLGMAIAANKIRGIRAVTCNCLYLARLAREHNDANVLCIGARAVGGGLAAEILSVFLTTPFAGERHARRVRKIHELEALPGKES